MTTVKAGENIFSALGFDEGEAENLRIISQLMMDIDKYRELFAICYQVAGSAVGGGMESDDDKVLLLNTLSRPDGPGTDILLNNEGPYQDVMDEALNAEKSG